MNELFQGLTKNEIQKLLKLFKSTTLFYKKGHSLSHTTHDNMIAIVIEGTFIIKNIDYDGNETILEEIEKNNIFGSNISFLTNPDVYVVAKEDSKVIILEYDYILNDSFIKYPYYNRFLINLNNINNNIIKEKNNYIQIITKKTIREKLLVYFKMLSKKQKTKYLYLPMSLTNLADYLSIDRSAMMREIKNLKEDGLINGKGKSIHLNY